MLSSAEAKGLSANGASNVAASEQFARDIGHLVARASMESDAASLGRMLSAMSRQKVSTDVAAVWRALTEVLVAASATLEAKRREADVAAQSTKPVWSKILAALAEQPQGSTALSTQTEHTTPVVSRALAEMAAAGLIERVDNHEGADGRQQSYRLTGAGALRCRAAGYVPPAFIDGVRASAVFFSELCWEGRVLFADFEQDVQARLPRYAKERVRNVVVQECMSFGIVDVIEGVAIAPAEEVGEVVLRSFEEEQDPEFLETIVERASAIGLHVVVRTEKFRDTFTNIAIAFRRRGATNIYTCNRGDLLCGFTAPEPYVLVYESRHLFLQDERDAAELLRGASHRIILDVVESEDAHATVTDTEAEIVNVNALKEAA
jgi:DNA-binding MarR family transcriptional regulator